MAAETVEQVIHVRGEELLLFMIRRQPIGLMNASDQSCTSWTVWASHDFPDTEVRYDDDLGGVRWEGGHLRPSSSTRRSADAGVVRVARCLAGFYEWLKRPLSRRAQENDKLLIQILLISALARRRYDRLRNIGNHAPIAAGDSILRVSWLFCIGPNLRFLRHETLRIREAVRKFDWMERNPMNFPHSSLMRGFRSVSQRALRELNKHCIELDSTRGEIHAEEALGGNRRCTA